jgi:hypothetical protein
LAAKSAFIAVTTLIGAVYKSITFMAAGRKTQGLLAALPIYGLSADGYMTTRKKRGTFIKSFARTVTGSSDSRMANSLWLAK